MVDMSCQCQYTCHKLVPGERIQGNLNVRIRHFATCTTQRYHSPDSVVVMEDTGFESQQEQPVFFRVFHPAVGSFQPRIRWVLGYL